MAPTKHGLDRKFKPWRRGKSRNHRASLKQQLRGQERLLAKTQDTQHRASLQASIQELRAQIGSKQKQDKERENAKKSHGLRFLERQRLCRMLRKAKSERERTQIALDQVYVAHYPLESSKYRPLFKKGVRVAADVPRRAAMRRKILLKLQSTSLDRVGWIAPEQYARLPKEWSIQQEQETFDYNVKETEQDDRFQLDDNHKAMLEAAERIEQDLSEPEDGSFQTPKETSDVGENNVLGEEKEPKPATRTNLNQKPNLDTNDTDSDSSSSSSDGKVPKQKPTMVGETPESTSSSDSDSSSADVPAVESTNVVKRSGTDSSESDSSSDSSSSSEAEEEKVPMKDVKTEEFDDFLVEADEDANPFARAKIDRGDAKGDKSKGWATQRQRPGQFKKRRLRK